MAGRHKKFLTPLRIVLGSILLLGVVSVGLWLLLHDKNIAVLNPQGVIAAQQKDLIIFTVLLSIVVVVPVFTILGVVAWKYREGNTKASYRPDEEGNTWLELTWWGIPIIIIGILGVVTWVSTHQLDPYKPIASDVKPLKVQVVALQWKWLFVYPDLGLATVNELRMPVGTPVSFDLTADAPMSAFWIPSLGSQVYAMNGMSSKLSLRADNPGTFHGSNTNINGEGYSDMTFNAIAMPRQDFEAWSAAIVRETDSEGNHMDWERYETLAEPSRKNKVGYYHLHDERLYNKIMEKYMSGHASSGTSDTSHAGGSH